VAESVKFKFFGVSDNLIKSSGIVDLPIFTVPVRKVAKAN
jgi:hypothetical protein